MAIKYADVVDGGLVLHCPNCTRVTLNPHGCANCFDNGMDVSGRTQEPDRAMRSPVNDILETDNAYLLCTDYTTHKTYGTASKYVPPGLRDALTLYNTVPRRDTCIQVLNPAISTSETVSARTILHKFSRVFIGAHTLPPSAHIIRKVFNKRCMKLNNDADAVADVVTILDAHGRTVQDKLVQLYGSGNLVIRNRE
jgi:hypothetical protein